MSRLERIFIRPSQHFVVFEVEEVDITMAEGVVGDYYQKTKRQVTLLGLPAWETACKELGKELSPAIRRANLVISDIDFKDSIGKILKIGDQVTIKLTGETKPCRLMDEAEPGLKAALTPDWRGGSYGEIITPGTISILAPVKFI